MDEQRAKGYLAGLTGVVLLVICVLYILARV